MADPMLRSDWLAAFSVFAEHRNFTRAARALHLSQPALHVQIAKLTEEIGVPLYLRRGRGLELTQEGIKLLAFARETQERCKDFVADLRGAGAQSRVALAAGEGAFLYLLGGAVRAFSKGNQVPLALLTRDRQGTIDALLSGEAHLGVAVLDSLPEGIALEPLCEVGQSLVVPRAHRLAKRRSVNARDMQGEALVVPPLGRPHRAMIARAMASAGVSWSVGAEASGWDLILHFASLGLGVAIVNSFCRVPAGMVAVPFVGLPLIQYSIASRAGAPARTQVERLRNMIRAHVQSARS